MPSKRIRRMVRQFPENGLKVLLEDPDNVRDLLHVLNVALLPRIDFSHMRVAPARFVHRDYRHLEADVVLHAPLLDPQGRRLARKITIYVLIEHQSEPDPFMLFRVLEYVVLIFKKQLQEWVHAHGTREGFRFQPVLPVVLYTGTRSWEGLGQLVDLVALGELVAEFTPVLKPLFLNLGQAPAADLERRGGAFGWLLRLVQQRKAGLSVFQQTLEQAVQALEELAEQDRQRWLELLSYLHALVYHERDTPEQEFLFGRIESSAQTDPHRREVFHMGKTIAEALREEGKMEGRKEEATRARQQTLIRQLRRKFGKLPAAMVQRIEATSDVAQLDAWLDEVIDARKLANVGIPAD